MKAFFLDAVFMYGEFFLIMVIASFMKMSGNLDLLWAALFATIVVAWFEDYENWKTKIIERSQEKN
jgi:hypothetical protein